MKLDEHSRILDTIRQSITDPVAIGLLQQLHSDYQTEIPRLESERDLAVTDFTTAKTERDEYAKINSQFWKQLNVQKLDELDKVEDGTKNSNQEYDKLTYDDLEAQFFTE